MRNAADPSGGTPRIVVVGLGPGGHQFVTDETRQAIEQCSCSIDIIASLLPYARYVAAETVMSMSQVRSDLGAPFRTSAQAAGALNDLRRAQAEAEVRCF